MNLIEEQISAIKKSRKELPWLLLIRNIPLILILIFAVLIFQWGLQWALSISGRSTILLGIGISFIIAQVINRTIFKSYNSLFTFKVFSQWIGSKSQLIHYKDRYKSLEKELYETIKVSGIAAEIRLLINEYAPSYGPVLKTLIAPGLAEIMDPSYEIFTDYRSRIQRLINSMPGGSIGVAGPRGVGKTTLLWSFCAPLVREINDKPTLTVLVSAPVEYNAREFILFLFASVCKRTLNIHNVPDDILNHWDFIDEQQKPIGRLSLESFIYSLADIFLGEIFIAIGLVVATISLIFSVIIITTSTASYINKNFPGLLVSSITSMTSSPATTNPTVTPILLSPTSPLITSTNNITDTVIAIVTNENTLTLFQTLGTSLGINPTSLLTFSLFAVIFGTIIMIIRMQLYEIREAEQAKRELSDVQLVRRTQILEQLPWVAKEARRWLQEIRFQQSYSSGWSGSLKFPVAVESNSSFAVSLAKNQLTLPEIIDQYREFLRLVSESFIIIIGIDELDKMESNLKANVFLNEIKAIFGIEKCFYLISVSENAIESFEKRGLPFRDVFDSTFDAIVRMDYFSLKHSQQLLRRRVTGIPVPHLCLCYCMSGGLPRDLIRVCRDIFNLANSSKEQLTISTICARLVKDDLLAKLRTWYVLQQEENRESNEEELLFAIHKAEKAVLLDEPLFILCQEWIQPDDGHRRIKLGAYLYYAQTIVEFFSDDLTKEILQKAEKDWFEKFTKARPVIATNPIAAIEIISEFRKHYGLKIIEKTPKRRSSSPTNKNIKAPVAETKKKP